jgi:tyrosinase
MSYDARMRYAQVIYQMKLFNGQFLAGSSQNINLYDAFQQMHASSLNGQLHGTSAFPPQHKIMIWLYESALRYVCQQRMAVLGFTLEQCCAIILPYWDWLEGFVQTSPTGSGNWNNIGNTDVFEYGDIMGDNTPQSGTNYIDTGVFAYTTSFNPTTSSKLRRSLTVSALSTSTTLNRIRQWITSSRTYAAFLPLIHGGLHGQFHVYVGYQMSSTNSAAQDPLFYMHHCNVDRLYHMWADCQGFEFVQPSAMTTTHYVAQNPIGGSGTPRRDPSGNAFDVGIDSPMNYYMLSTTATFFPQSTWPTPRQSFSMGPNGWGGINYRYGPDWFANSITSSCPDSNWNWVNQNA